MALRRRAEHGARTRHLHQLEEEEKLEQVNFAERDDRTHLWQRNGDF